MGSGSSRIAAYMAGLDYYGCEIDPVYYKDAQERFERVCKNTVHIGEKTIIHQALFD